MNTSWLPEKFKIRRKSSFVVKGGAAGEKIKEVADELDVELMSDEELRTQGG